MSRPITLAFLHERGACLGQRRLFKKIFGESVVPTLKLVDQYAETFQLSWAAGLLNSAGYSQFCSADSAAYWAHEQRREKNRSTFAGAEFELSLQRIPRSERQAKLKVLKDEHRNAEARSRTIYYRKRAAAFVRAWNSQ